MDNVIKLSYYEMLQAAQAGAIRQIENIKKNRTPYYGAGDQNDWQLHIEGCMGELALSKFLNVYCSGKGGFRMPDVDEVDVRTRSKDFYELILHPDDPDDRIFWLVTGFNGTYKIRGWIKAKDGKKDEYWNDPYKKKFGKSRPAFFVPHSALEDPNFFDRKNVTNSEVELKEN